VVRVERRQFVPFCSPGLISTVGNDAPSAFTNAARLFPSPGMAANSWRVSSNQVVGSFALEITMRTCRA